MKRYLERVIEGETLSTEEARAAMSAIMRGEANHSQIAGFLVALKSKGEAPSEIAGFALAMRDASVNVPDPPPNAIDVCGTGGDNSGTLNLSTIVSFVVAAAGVPVAKHGNRSISSKSGSADVLKELGVAVDLSPENASRALKEIGVAFLFAPMYHPAMKHAAPVRKELAMKTVFNILGPLTNPAGVKRQMIGVFNDDAANKMREAAADLAPERIALVCADDAYDEITLSGTANVYEYEAGERRDRSLQAKDFGYESVAIEELRGGDPKVNAERTLAILGEKTLSGAGKVAAANAALALQVAGFDDDLGACVRAAEETIVSGAAIAKLRDLVAFSERVQ
ncbi:MAG: anthranilate phosphoribosyltransferase [Ignavibacteriales bacterium]|nr:anthranilate phosphoribosyltransferase [Ignavibacteriales bacterium]